MNTPLVAIARRRAELQEQIAQEREAMAALLVDLRTQLAIAGLAMVAGRLLRRSRWMRLLAAGGAAFAAALPLVSRILSTRRERRATTPS